MVNGVPYETTLKLFTLGRKSTQSMPRSVILERARWDPNIENPQICFWPVYALRCRPGFQKNDALLASPPLQFRICCMPADRLFAGGL